MSRLWLRLALVPVTIVALESCRDVPTAPAGGATAASLDESRTLPQAIDATIQEILSKGHRSSVDARWRNVKARLDGGQSRIARQMFIELAEWIERSAGLNPLPGETRAHAAARLVLYMASYVYRDPTQPMPPVPATGADAVVRTIAPTAAAVVVTGDGRAGVSVPRGAVAEPTVLVLYADESQARDSCTGPLDTELCQFPSFYHVDVFPHQRLKAPARVGVCGPETMPARSRLAHARPASGDATPGGVIADGIEILPAANVADFLACGTGGLTVSFSEFNPVDPTPRYSRYCPSETDRTLTYADLDSAIVHAPESNIVVVCDGTWPANEVKVNRAITIRAENHGGATLEQPHDATAGQAVLRIDGVASGDVRIVDLSVLFAQSGVHALGTFDRVELDSMRMTGPGGTVVSEGVRIEGSSVSSAQVTVRRSTFRTSYYGIRQLEPVGVDTYESRFEDIWWAGVILSSAPRTNVPPRSVTGQAMQKADAIGNTFINTPRGGVGAAISIQQAGQHLIQGNTFSNPGVGGAGSGGGASAVFTNRLNVAAAHTRPVRIRDNVIVGRAATGDPAQQTNWGVGSAFRVTQGAPGVPDSVIHNTVTGAFIGLDANAEMIAFDNTISGVYVAVRKNGPQPVAITRNDFTGYTFPIVASAQALPGNPSLMNGSVACNWWGSAAAPAPLGPNVNAAGYMPFATQPIANTEVACTVSTDAPPVVRFCPTVSGAMPTYAALSQAIQAVAPGGTIKVCDGTHAVPETALGAKALTIEAEGPGIPTLAGTLEKVFNIFSATPNDRAIVLRRLSLRSVGTANLRVTQQYGTVLIDQVAFHPNEMPIAPGQTLSSGSGVDIGSAVGAGITVRNSTFDGGDIGVNVNASSNVVVTGSTFSNHRNAAVHVRDGGAVTVSGNTVSSCGVAWCISFWGGGNHQVLDNTITVDFARRTEGAIQVHHGAVEIRRNKVAGIGGARDPEVPSSWPVHLALSVNDGATVIADENEVSGAYIGLGFGPGVTGTARDNVVSFVAQGVGGQNEVVITRSDFTNYARAFDGAGSGTVRCNWWGSALGPRNVPPWVSPDAYTPWSLTPIARQPGVSCS